MAAFKRPHATNLTAEDRAVARPDKFKNWWPEPAVEGANGPYQVSTRNPHMILWNGYPLCTVRSHQIIDMPKLNGEDLAATIRDIVTALNAKEPQ